MRILETDGTEMIKTGMIFKYTEINLGFGKELLITYLKTNQEVD